MSLDPGQVLPLPRRRKRLPTELLLALGLGAVLLSTAALPALLILETWLDHHAEERAWDIAGPPCPVVQQPATWAKGRRAPKVSHFQAISFTRGSGNISCEAFNEKGLTQETYQVCQFNLPGYVAVDIGQAQIIYQPPVGKPATVKVRHGAPSCVVGGWFTF
jgi:hypothetical protein